MAYEEKMARKPGRPVMRAFGAAALYVAVAVFALAFFPALIQIAIFLVGPAGAAFLFAGSPPDHDTFAANGFFVSFASGLTGAGWIIAGGQGDAEPPAIAIGALFSLIFLTILPIVVVYFVGKRIGNRPPPDADDEDE